MNRNGVFAPPEDPTPTSILFGAPASNEEASGGLFISKLFLLWRLSVFRVDAKATVNRWKENTSRFSTVVYLA